MEEKENGHQVVEYKLDRKKMRAQRKKDVESNIKEEESPRVIYRHWFSKSNTAKNDEDCLLIKEKRRVSIRRGSVDDANVDI